MISETLYAALSSSRLFNGLDHNQMEYALDFFSSSRASYKKGELLHYAGEPLCKFGLVLAGTVEVFMDDMDGNQMLMANVVQGETFGESLCYLCTEESPVYILAAEDCTVLWLSADSVRMPAGCPGELDFALMGRFISMLAERTLNMNDRIQILSKGTIRGKLLTFFSQCEHKYGSKTFIIPFGREGLADYIGSNRSAVSRELSLMKRDGIIDFYRNSFRIL